MRTPSQIKQERNTDPFGIAHKLAEKDAEIKRLRAEIKRLEQALFNAADLAWISE